VVDPDGSVVGIISEGDLIRRSEIIGEQRPSVLRIWMSDSADLAKNYIKSHGQLARDIMTTDVVTVDVLSAIATIARRMVKHGVKRLPVLLDGKLTGIVSRGDLVPLLVDHPSQAETPERRTDSAVCVDLKKVFNEQGLASGFVDVFVEDGVVHLSGSVENAAVGRALKVAAETIAGVKMVDAKLRVYGAGPAYGSRRGFA
jgi:CBS-domain-containing membrane protein